ncbi:MAG: MBL fold metallo-hydrolase [Lachnospiraceae bacterium]|nr:MBL fold metallo-hydrolase [Lachnospiraceae bacterium]
MKVCSIASGSSGNCIYVGEGRDHVLIDAGISRKRIVDGLHAIGVEPEELSGILVTHEHVDHMKGIPMMAKMFGTPVFATGGTLDELLLKDKNQDMKRENLYQVYSDEPIAIGRFHITPFSMSHDAAEPVCYTVETAGKKVGIATDLGVYDESTIHHLSGSDCLFLEANHDISMLEAGSYPYQLKCRILGSRGHLSNEAAGQLLCKLWHKRLKYVFLAHLSKENNYPGLAYEAVKCELWEGLGMTTLPFSMSVAEREQPSELVSF